MVLRQKLPDKRDVLIVALLILLPVLSFAALFFSDKTLYRWDINVRMSTVIGLVGALARVGRA